MQRRWRRAVLGVGLVWIFAPAGISFVVAGILVVSGYAALAGLAALVGLALVAVAVSQM